MKYADYLTRTHEIAVEEFEVLNELSQILKDKGELSKIEVRAAKNSMQIMIENCIGKGKQILKHFDCPVVPARSREVFQLLLDVGAIDEEFFSKMNKAIGFRNSMIHDYMNFDIQILLNILINNNYFFLTDYLSEAHQFTSVVLNRIKNYSY